MNLPDLFIPNLSDGKLDCYAVKNGVQLEIKQYDNAQPNDVIIVFWGDVYVLTQLVNSVGDFPFIFNVSKNFPPSCLLDGTYEVSYVVINTQTFQRSNTVSVAVSTVC